MDLIDTLWNVKAVAVPQLPAVAADLIDTLWNVKNIIVYCRNIHDVRFNRYIVECKGIAFAVYPCSRYGFNRYIVECKAKTSD